MAASACIDDNDPLNRQQHYIFPVMWGELPHGIEYNVGPGFGLTRRLRPRDHEIQRRAGAIRRRILRPVIRLRLVLLAACISSVKTQCFTTGFRVYIYHGRTVIVATPEGPETTMKKAKDTLLLNANESSLGLAAAVVSPICQPLHSRHLRPRLPPDPSCRILRIFSAGTGRSRLICCTTRAWTRRSDSILFHYPGRQRIADSPRIAGRPPDCSREEQSSRTSYRERNADDNLSFGPLRSYDDGCLLGQRSFSRHQYFAAMPSG